LIKYAKLEVIDSVNMITDLKTYMTDTNPIAAWFGVNYVYDEDGETITVNDLRAAFNKYLPDKNRLTDQKFGKNLKKLVDVVKSHGKMVVNHLKILKIDEDE
jgi:hypothetical protein